MASEADCYTACLYSSQFSYLQSNELCLCFPFTGSNALNDGCYVGNIWCSYETAGYPCYYSTGTSALPKANSSCNAGAVWGYPINNVLSSTTESSVRDCYLKCH